MSGTLERIEQTSSLYITEDIIDMIKKEAMSDMKR